MSVPILIFSIVLVITSVALALSVLLHKGRGGGLSDLFGGGISTSLGGSSVAERNLDRLTIIIGVVWLASIIALNLRAPFLCTRAALRIMKPQRAGRIINVGSIASHRVRPKSAPYATTKHGIWGLTQVTALEGREYGVTCCCLKPGNVLVERRHTNRAEDDEPMMTVDEIAEVAVLMATLPPHVELLEATCLPMRQEYVGRG